MLLKRSMLAGLLLALPNAAVFSQDNPWRVPSAPNGYVPGYAVREQERAAGSYLHSQQPRQWSQQPAQDPPGGYSRRQEQGWTQGGGLYAGYQWPGPQDNGYTAYRNEPRQQRQAAVNPYSRYDVPPASAPVTGPSPRWSGGTGYRPGSATATGSVHSGQAHGSSYGTAPQRRAPINQYPPYGGYGEYPPLDGDPTTQQRREPPAQRESTNRENAASAPAHAAPPAIYGPSTLTVPYTGLPGLGGYGYGGLHGYPARPYRWGW